MTTLDDGTFDTIARKLSEALNALHPKIGIWMGKGGGPEFDELAEAAGGVGEAFEGGVTAYWNINDVMVLLQEAREKPEMSKISNPPRGVQGTLPRVAARLVRKD